MRLSPVERSSSDNGIWLCQQCAKLVDSDERKYTVEILAAWKVASEQRTIRELVGIPEDEFFPQPASASHTPIPKISSRNNDKARELLIKAGWQPRMNHWTHTNNFDMQYHNNCP